MAGGVSLAASAAVALDSDPALAKLLAVASTDLAEPTVDTLSVLHAALARDRVIGRYEWPADIEVNSFWTDLHPGGSRLVASGYFGSPSTHLEVYDFDHDEVLWAWDVPGGDRAIVVDRPRFVGDGSILVHGVYWQSDVAAEEEPPADVMGVHIRDAGTGELVRRIDLGRCGGLVVGAAETHLAVVSVPESSDTCFDLNISDEPLLLELVSLADGERRVVTDDLFADLAAMSGDGSVVAFLTWEVWEASVADTDTLAVRELPGTDIFIDPDVVHLNHDGSLLVLGNRPIALFDVATAERLAFLWGHAGSAWSFAFDSGGDRVYSSGREGTVRALDTQGRPLAAFPAVGSGRLSMTEQGRMLVTSGDGRGATLLDLGAGGETGGVSTCDGFGIAGTLQVAGGYGVHTEYCGVGAETRMTTFVSDLAAGEVSFEIADQAGQRLATSPDGRYLARQDADASPGEYPLDWAGSIRIRELRTGMVVSELQGLCNFTWTDESDCAEYPDTPFRLWALALAWSADGRWLAAANHGAAGNEVVAWDVESGKMLGGYDGCLLGAESVLFTADASNLLVACSEEGAIVRVSTTAWQETERRALPLDVAGRDRLGFIGYTAGDEHILAVTGVLGRGGGSLLWIDPLTLEVVDSIHSIHAGSPKSWTMNADRTLAATGSSDGFVKVWDLIARRLHQEIYLGAREGQGVAFVDDGHLAVVTSTGGIQVYTLDPDELVAIARASLSRGFTAAECQKYFAGGSCPALPTLRGE